MPTTGQLDDAALGASVLGPADLLLLAERAVELAHSQPMIARESALTVVRQATAPLAAAALAMAERALGQVANLVEDPVSARRHLARSVHYARLDGNRHAEAQARLARAFTFAQEGRFAAGLLELDRAEAELLGNDWDMGRVHNQRALIWWLRGGYEQAVPIFGLAVERSTRAGDDLNVVRVLINRGVLSGRLGSYAAAERDLKRAEELANRLDLPMMVAVARQDLGWVAAQRGDVPAALAHYDQAESDYQPHCEELGTLLLDRCDVLLGARLLTEAVATAERALAVFTEGGVATAVPEAELYLAETLLLSARADDARRHAESALRTFRQHRRPGWTAQARYAVLRANLLDEKFDKAEARRVALRVATSLQSSGLLDQALDVRVVAARLGLDAGLFAAAKRELAAASSARSRGTVERRTRAWHAEALLRLASGDRRGARSALRAGLRILEEHRAMLGATDLRAAASIHRIDIARLGFAMSIADGRPGEALSWVERSRAGLARLRAVRPPDDEPLAQALTQLRATLREVDDAVRAGERIAGLRTKQMQLERAIRDHCRSLPAGELMLPGPPPPLAALARRLGDRVLVEYVVHEGELYVLVLAHGRASVRNLGAATEIENAVRLLAMLLDRAARNLGDAARRRDTLDRLSSQARLVDELIVAPLRADLADASVVIAPTGSITSVPWFALPTLRGRAVTVVPSATVWFEAAAPDAAAGSHVVLAAGPHVPAAEREVTLLAQLYPGSRTLTGAGTTVAAALSALDGATLAHIAAHGTFRADNPLFSSLRLADGPLTIYDLESIAVAPRTVVLAACDSAQQTAQPGDELLGIATAFLSLGTRTLIAPLVTLPDGEAAALMVDLHTRLCAGAEPAAALAATQQAATSASDDGAFAAAAGLVCFGAS